MIPKHLALAVLFFTAFACSGDNTITYGGKVYKTVKIGTQTWIAENLNYAVEGSKCYDNNPANCAKYGRLYNWETAMKVCPKGWHLPSNAEWDKLLRFVDGSTGLDKPYYYYSPTAGKHLKATSDWDLYKESDGNGTNDYGFSALPGGSGFSTGFFHGAGGESRWWSSSTESSDYHAYANNMFYSGVCILDTGSGPHFLSVRCVKD